MSPRVKATYFNSDMIDLVKTGLFEKQIWVEI